MFDFSVGSLPVPDDLSGLFTRTFEDIARAGNGWSGAEKIAIAGVARNNAEPDPLELLPPAAIDAATRIATQPSGSTEPWVSEIVSTIGETEYVELVSVAAAMAAIDTITRLLQFGVEALPEPLPGDPFSDAPHPRLKRRSAWVSMSGPATPRHALSAAPSAQATCLRLIDRLYMPADRLQSNDPVRGLTRLQMEIVILKLSHSNKCFY